ncbi:MAG: hypothetical protein Q9204_006270, partial [Flavoplaca sp. TL-2023a]
MAFNFNWSPLTADASFYTRAQELLTTALNKYPKPPIIVDDIIVNELNLGSVPPDLEILEIGDLAEDRFRGIFKMCYTGDAYLTLKTRANPLNTYLSTRPSFTSPQPLAASSGLTIPLQITLSEIKLSAFIILVFSRQKGLTLVFRNDPLESLKVSSTFDAIPFVRDYLQKEIEGQLRTLLMDEVPAIIHRLSLRLWCPEYRAKEDEESARRSPNPTSDEQPVDPLASPPQDPIDVSGNFLDASQIASLSLDTNYEHHSLFSQKNLLRLAALTDSHRTLSLFTPGIRDAVFRAWTGPSERGELHTSSAKPILPAISRAHSWAGTTSHMYTFSDSQEGPSSARPTLSSFGSTATGSGLVGNRPSKPHNGRRKKHRVVNLRKKAVGGEDGQSITDEGSTVSSTASSAQSEYGGTWSSQEREGEMVTPPQSPPRKAASRERALLDDNAPIFGRHMTPRHTTFEQADDLTPKPLKDRTPNERPLSASRRPRLRTSHTYNHPVQRTEKAQTQTSVQVSQMSSIDPFQYLESPTGGILEQAWMMKMAGEIARRVNEEKAANNRFWDRPSDGMEETPPPASKLLAQQLCRPNSQPLARKPATKELIQLLPKLTSTLRPISTGSSSRQLLSSPYICNLASCTPLRRISVFSQPAVHRCFSQNAITCDSSAPATNSPGTQTKEDDDPDAELGLEQQQERSFGKSEKASQAAQVNLSARLSKEGRPQGQKAGLQEIWRLIKIARPEAKVLSVAFVFLLVSSGISMSIPFSIGKIMDIATKPETGSEQLFGLDLTTFYIALGGVLALGAAANYGRIIILRIVGERIVTRLRSQLFRRTFVQNAEFFDANRTGDLISRLSSDTIIVGKSITQNLSDGLRSLVSGGAGLGLMAYVSLKLTSILALMFPPVAIGAFFYGRVIRNLSRKIQKNLGTLTKIAEERLGNVRTSQAFAGEILEVNRYNKQVRKIFDLGKREAWISATFFSTTGLMGNMTIIAILWVGGGMVKSGAITIGELSSFLMYTVFAGSSLFGLSSFYSELMKGVGAASRLFELQDRHPTISPTVGNPVKSARGPIRFENLSFSYPTRPAVGIFNGLSFEIPQGTNVAIVGPSGGGKSTIASLMLRFYTPTQGTIKIDGVDISTMNVKSLRRKIGLVAQEPVLFSGTIAENVAYGKPKASQGEINAAARKANCRFIEDFPDGLKTFVGARGAQLSGGQKQRIAIARALVKNPDILILDEATSALDAESETLVNSALGALLAGNNTTISIAHRLSTIKRSDTIIVLSSDGKVAEQGSYQELSSKPDGAFTKLMEWQMSGSDMPGASSQPQQRQQVQGDTEPEVKEGEELMLDVEEGESAVGEGEGRGEN